MVSQGDGSIIDLDSLDTLSFDQFGRDPSQDVMCIAPARTMVLREEEIALVHHHVHKEEEVDASPACPVNSTQITKVYQGEGLAAQSRVSG